MNVQHKDFADRIARIEAGENSFKSMIFVGNDEPYRADELRRAVTKPASRKRPTVRAKPVQAQKKRGSAMLTMPLAFLIGAGALVLWRLADFQMNGVSSLLSDPTQMLAVNAATGMALAILICQVTALTAPQHVLAAFLGLVAMTFGFQNAVNLAPEQFAELFSPAWVGQLLAMNAPATLIFG